MDPTTLEMISLQETGAHFRVVFPLSILESSSVSLIRERRIFPALSIFSRYPFTAEGSFDCCARLVYPRTAFIGVRMSWLTFERNSVFIWLACLASFRATDSFSARSLSCFSSSVMSVRKKRMSFFRSSR
jgi:hypothetical protein